MSVQERTAVVVGGSIGGLTAAHALYRAGWNVTILERYSDHSSHPSGAGLNVDAMTCAILKLWGFEGDFWSRSCAFPVEEHRAIDPVTKKITVLSRAEKYNNRATHWSDLHRILLQAWPSDKIHFMHEVTGFEQRENSVHITAIAKNEGNTEKLFKADLMVAADGIGSQTRATLLPSEPPKRYAGFFAWRGVLDQSDAAMLAAVRQERDRSGSCIYFEVSDDPISKSHMVIFELPGNRINWMWYWNSPEPTGDSQSGTTMRATPELRKQLWEEAERCWTPATADVIKATSEPFINVIYDRDPIPQLVYGRVLLLGEAAHPTTPHCARSTNMAVMDSYTLGKLLGTFPDDTEMALWQWERERIPDTTQQVLFSRSMGQLRQGHWFVPGRFQWSEGHGDLGHLLTSSTHNKFIHDFKAHCEHVFSLHSCETLRKKEVYKPFPT